MGKTTRLASRIIIHRPDAKEAGVCSGCVHDLGARLTQFLSSKGLDEPDLLYSQIPLVDWVVSEEVPGTVALTLLCHESPSSGIHNFFHELVSRHLHPGRRAPILSSRCLTFSFAGGGDAVFYFGVMLVAVAKEAERKEMVLQVPHVTHDLKRGVVKPEWSDRILEKRGLTFDQKIAYSRRRVLRLFERFKIPHLDEIEIEQGWWQMSIAEGWLKGRGLSHLSWLLASLALLRQQVRKEAYLFPEQRGVRVALCPVQLRYPFGIKEVLAVVVAIRLGQGIERLDESHLMEAASEVIPGLKGVKDSFFAYQTPHDEVQLLYIEVEGASPGRIASQEIASLKRELGGELKDRVQKLTPTLFTQRNDEEVLRSLHTLARELRYVGDPPQVVISYQKMGQDSLVFGVICVRILRQESPTMAELFGKLPASWRCRLEHEQSMGTLRKKYPKSASVFTVTLDKRLFLRKDHAVDLTEARSHIVEGLSGVFGLFRDYNGGLMVKQSEVLRAARAHLGSAVEKREDLLEMLFYSLTPAVIQSYLSPELLGALFHMMVEVLAHPVSSKLGYSLNVRHEPGGTLLFIRGVRPTFKQEVLDVAKASCTDPLNWSHTFVEVGSSCCLALLLLGSGAECVEKLTAKIKEVMGDWVVRQRNRQVIRLYVARATTSLDPRIGVDRRSGVVIKMLYEGLMRLGEEGKPYLAIARQVDTSNDGRVYTFWLRDSLWSDGRPLTAHDFEYAWKKAIDPGFPSRHAYLFFPIKNARQVRDGKLPIEAFGVRAEGEDRLVVELENPIPYFLDYVTHWSYSPVPRNIDERAPGWAYKRGAAYVCNGPFKLEKGRAGESLFLVKNPHYWDVSNVTLAEIHLVHTEDSETTYAMFDQGKIDWIGEPLCDLPPAALKRSEINAVPSGGVCSLDINVGQIPFSSKKMRQAFAYAIDRQTLVEEVLRGRGKAAYSLVPLGMEPTLVDPFPDGDLEVARQLFEEGLAELGVERGEIGPILLSYPILNEQPEMARYIARCWQEAFGIRVTADGWPWQSYLGDLYDSVVQVAAKTWYSWISDPIYSLEPYQFAANTFNGSRWENRTYVDLLEEAERLADPSARMEKLAKAEAILVEEMPAIPLYHVKHHSLINPHLHRVHIANIGQIDFKSSYIGDAASSTESKSALRPLRLNIRAEPLSLDPRIGVDSNSITVVKMLFEGLMHIGPGGKPEPGLAREVEVGADGTLYTFTLRPSTWTDGEPVTAYDFEYGWKQVLDPNFTTVYDYPFVYLYNGEAAKRGEVPLDEVGVRALGPDKLCVRLKHPVPYFLELISNPVFAPIPRHLAKEGADWHQSCSTFVGNGPFQLFGWDKGRQMILRKNPSYWEADRVQLDGINLSIGASAQMHLHSFERGEVDWAGQPLSDLPIDQLTALDEKGVLHAQSIAGVFRLDMNCQKVPFTSKKMRKALSWAIDRGALQEEVLRGKEYLADSFLPLHLSPGDVHQVVLGDREQARLYFAQALTELGLSKEAISPLVFSYPLIEHYRVMAQFLQRQWQEAFDIPILLEGLDWKSYLAKLRSGFYQMGNVLWFSWVNDPTYNLRAYQRKGFFVNLCQWEHADYSAQLDAARQAPSEEERLACLQKAEELVREEAPSIPLCIANYKYLKNEALQGVFISSLGWIDFRWAYFVPTEGGSTFSKSGGHKSPSSQSLPVAQATHSPFKLGDLRPPPLGERYTREHVPPCGHARYFEEGEA